MRYQHCIRRSLVKIVTEMLERIQISLPMIVATAVTILLRTVMHQ